MRILYLTTPGEDYLQDQILLGLRESLGTRVLDFPRKSVLYRNCAVPRRELYGRGFTLWKLLDDIEMDRGDLNRRLEEGEFETLIFGNIWRQRREFREFRTRGYLRRWFRRVGFLDGEDHKRPYLPALRHGLYFKREIRLALPLPRIRRINFSIPGSKLRARPLEKDRLFARHVQCEEAYKLEVIRSHCRKSYLFEKEQDYYRDLARSRYAVTMKKMGWECQRHYEIAANHTVPCFYRLSRKPRRCAPHGLVDGENVLAFDSAGELQEKIEEVRRNGRYAQLRQGAYQWAARNTCRRVAGRLLKALEAVD